MNHIKKFENFNDDSLIKDRAEELYPHIGVQAGGQGSHHLAEQTQKREAYILGVKEDLGEKAEERAKELYPHIGVQGGGQGSHHLAKQTQKREAYILGSKESKKFK